MPETINGRNRENSTLKGEPGFCAFVHDQVAVRRESTDVKSFCDILPTASVCWIDYIINDVEKDSLEAALAMGFSEHLVNNLLKNKKSGYEDLENEMGILLPAITVHGFDVKLCPLIILIKKNVVITLHTTEVQRFVNLRRYAETFMRKLPKEMPQNDKITSLLIRLIDENNSRNFEHLLEIEEQGDKLSEQLIDPKTPRDTVGRKIHEMKHALITYLSGLWATVDVLGSVRYGDADLLSDDEKILNKITALMNEVNSQIGLAEHLSEVLASGLEVVQSIYNNQLQILNNRLALLVGYLTIIGTAMMVPNTLATALSGPMFHLGPEDIVWYSAVLIISTIVSTLVAWIVVKRLGLLPKRKQGED